MADAPFRVGLEEGLRKLFGWPATQVAGTNTNRFHNVRVSQRPDVRRLPGTQNRFSHDEPKMLQRAQFNM